jgi:hypothetical protein
MSLFGHGSWDNYTSFASEGECDENGFGGTAIINVWFTDVSENMYACQPRYQVMKCNGKGAAGDSLSWAIGLAEKYGDEYIIESCWIEDYESVIATGRSDTLLKIYELQDCSSVLVDAPEEEDDDEDIEGCMDSNAINYDEQATTDDGSCKYEEDGMDMKVILALAAVAAVAMFA